jgi:hypothetical protein
MAREVLIVGELNDGLEPQYPTTDVPRLTAASGKVEVLFGQELDRHMGDQLPGWTCFQGNADDPDNGDVGLGIRNGLMDITDVFWVNLATWKAWRWYGCLGSPSRLPGMRALAHEYQASSSGQSR